MSELKLPTSDVPLNKISYDKYAYLTEFCRYSIDFNEEVIQHLEQFHEYNVVVLGQAQSGQTALCIRLYADTFVETFPSMELYEFVRDLPEQNARLHIFDLIGITSNDILRLNSIVIQYSQYAFVTFSVADHKWQQYIHNWMLFIKTINYNCRIIAVGNKSDLPPVVTVEEVQAYIDTSMYIVKVVFCSAKTGDGIDGLLDLPWFTNYKYKRLQMAPPEYLVGEQDSKIAEQQPERAQGADPSTGPVKAPDFAGAVAEKTHQAGREMKKRRCC